MKKWAISEAVIASWKIVAARMMKFTITEASSTMYDGNLPSLLYHGPF
ncbi:MAG: hypothetical protein V8Q57_09435 [Blautia sp.]